MARGGAGRFTKELKEQPAVLQRFLGEELPMAPRGSIFVGAGDSYAAAVGGFYASKGSCIAADPYHLATTPEAADGVDVIIVSVSGRTASNVAAARKVRRTARRTIAVTADEGSELANLADEVVKLPVAYASRMPGLISFSLSLLAVLKMAGRHEKCDFRAAFASASEDRSVSWGKGTTFFLGNHLAYPVALYAAAKTYEFLGMKAHPELVEEFSHLELFALEASDSINVFASFDPLARSRKLDEALSRRGYEVNVVPGWGSTDLERLFHDVIAIQTSVPRKPEEMGISKPSFLTSKKRLEASDTMIY